MTRKLTALVFLGRMALAAQQPQALNPRSDPPPTFSKADMDRLVADFIKVIRSNTQSGTQILAKRFSADLEKAVKVPPAQRAAAMEKATEDYRRRVDGFNQDGQERINWAEATSPIVNPMHPEFGYWKNLLDACVEGRRFATRTEGGMPVYQQVTPEGGATAIHTFTPALPIEETTSSKLTARALCPSLVRNAVKASPPGIAESSAPAGMPKAMQICAAACATLEWANGHYEVLARDGAPATTYTVESFTPKSVTLNRTELPHSGDHGLTAVYKGTFKDGGNTAQGTVDFTWPGHQGFPHSGNWTATALEPTGFLFLDPDVPCNAASFRGTGAEAAARASRALDAKKQEPAVCWLRIGVTKGDANAQGLLAAILYLGSLGIPPDYPQALSLAKKSAEQGNYLGELGLSVMYGEGKATPKDPAQAQHWRAKAEETKSASIKAQQLADNERRQQQLQAQRVQMQQSQARMKQNIAGLLLLGALFGVMSESSGSGASSSGDPVGASQANRSACGYGFSSLACAKAGMPNPNHDQ